METRNRPCSWARRAVIVAAVFVMAAVPAAAQQVRALVSTDSVRVGDRFTLSLLAEAPPGAEAVFPSVEGDTLRFGDLEVLSQQVRTGYSRDSVRVDSVVFEVTTFALDTAFVPPIRILFTTEDDSFTAASAPIHVMVASLVPPDAEEIRDLAPLVAFPTPIWPWLLLALAVIAVIAALIYYRRRRRAPEPAAPVPARTPYQEAMQRLEDLDQFPLDAEDDVKPFYVELSELVRTYLSGRLHVNAMEQTTRELVRDLEARSPLAVETIHGLRVILELADFVKFADGRPGPDRARTTLSDTRQLIETVEHRAERPAEPAAAPAVDAPPG